MSGTLDVGTLVGYVDFDLSGMDKSFDEAEGKMSRFEGGMSKWATAAGAGIGLALGAAVASAINTDAANRKLTAQLGLTKDEAARFGKLGGELLASGYGSGLEDVNEGIAAVVRNIGGMRDASEDDLKSITGQVISLATTMGEDLGEVARTVGVMMKTGMAKDAQEALDLVTAGLQSPVNAAGDLLDTFNEYSTIFRTLGLEGEDALGLLQRGLQGGARDADQVADALKEMLLGVQSGDSRDAISKLGLDFGALQRAMAAGGEQAKTATGQLLDAFTALPPSVEKNGIAVQLFGSLAEDAQAALSSLDPRSAAAEFEAAFGPINGSAKEFDETVSGGLQSSLDTLLGKVKSFGAGVAEDLTPALQGGISILGGLVDALGPVLGLLGDIPDRGPPRDRRVPRSQGPVPGLLRTQGQHPRVPRRDAPPAGAGHVVRAVARHDGRGGRNRLGSVGWAAQDRRRWRRPGRGRADHLGDHLGRGQDVGPDGRRPAVGRPAHYLPGGLRRSVDQGRGGAAAGLRPQLRGVQGADRGRRRLGPHHARPHR
ncbi:phage tail tape measure protein [Nakamurella leprariae]|uniref:Phage tail tape measure protein n=1 Tax=Nakamurella leprariae TaxID=2803911 RepID=A0A939C0E9_9ACTN|nr:phage tail tape measure protein [Nakamurella leprariae]MBM9466092.1 phage tail tape measure protein [Nakamurella leprariae]